MGYAANSFSQGSNVWSSVYPKGCWVR